MSRAATVTASLAASEPEPEFEPSPHEQMRWGLRSLAAFAGVGLLTATTYAIAVVDGSAIGAAALALLVSGACLASGGFLGFLFGIPRTRSLDAPEAGETDAELEANRYSPNTNLEQISDWLTKILVGVGLTQFGTLPTKVDALAAYVAPAFAGSKAMALAVLVFFSVGGFLVGFLWTRLYLKRAMQAADEVYRELRKTKKRLAAVRDAKALDDELRNLVERQLVPGGPEVARHELEKAIAAASPEARAHAFDRAARVRTETWRQPATKVLMERTIPIFRALIAADENEVYHRYYGQLGFALKDSRVPLWEEAERALSKAIAIRDFGADRGSPAWIFYEFVRAHCRIQLDPDFARNAPSTPEKREEILADLRVGLGLGELVRQDELVRRWAALNDIEIGSLKK